MRWPTSWRQIVASPGTRLSIMPSESCPACGGIVYSRGGSRRGVRCRCACGLEFHCLETIQPRQGELELEQSASSDAASVSKEKPGPLVAAGLLKCSAWRVRGEAGRDYPSITRATSVTHLRALRGDRPSPPSDPDWSRLVRATLAFYFAHQGIDDAVSRLRSHVPHWPAPARRALERIAGGAL